MKKLQTFDEFLNESFRIDSKDERILGKMPVKSATTYKPDWELNIVELIEDGETWIIISGQYAKKTTDADTIWIRKDEFDEFKKLINSI